MGGVAPNYKRFRAFALEVRNKERKIKGNIIMVKDGNGRYPKCLEGKPYPEICPKETPDNPENVPKECKFCPEHLESPFHLERSNKERLRRIKELGLPTKIETKHT